MLFLQIKRKSGISKFPKFQLGHCHMHAFSSDICKLPTLAKSFHETNLSF